MSFILPNAAGPGRVGVWRSSSTSDLSEARWYQGVHRKRAAGIDDQI